MSKILPKSSLIAVVATALLLGGCAEVSLLSHGAKRLNSSYNSPATTTASIGDIDRGEAKLGNPYQVYGIWYYPKADPGYDETGIASWYGRRFHGKPTASGEPYDMYAMTAAHRTLPLPSYVRVTNLSNRRSVIVRVNDRGPFMKNRLIDLSWTAAKKLDFIEDGHARVLVELVQIGRAHV